MTRAPSSAATPSASTSRWLHARTSPQTAVVAVEDWDDDLLHRHFEKQADLHPDGVAVVEGDSWITYDELDRRANRLAQHLRARGIRRGTRAGLLLPRGIDAYTAMLGVLKAGGTYIPLDPEWPADRIAFILHDAGATALVTVAPLAEPLEPFDAEIVLLDTHAAAIAASPPIRLTQRATGLSPADLSYIIYTSGSTGRPKGVMVEHRSVCHLVRVEGELFGVAPYDRVLQGASLAFDLSIEETWLAFHAGATLVAASTEMMRSGPDLGRHLADAGVTVLSCVPTLLTTLATDVPTVRLLILGGEVCPETIVKRWARDGRRVVNTYGPTETTVTATWVDLEPGRAITIGRALPGCTVRVLDQQLRSLAPGETGEICIGGNGVARGYVGLEVQTRERFVPDPYEASPDARLYRTGDLGRLTPEGEIEFLGRGDGQVKVRGYRIELSEIEAVLAECDGVLAAACTVRDDASGLAHLVAYLVMRAQATPDLDAIRAHARARLPAYMVPATIESISTLPRRSSGKLDRDALPAPSAVPEDPVTRGRAPSAGPEATLAVIWQELFAPTPVGVDDDFFLDLGGHSMLAARMVSELRKHQRFARVSMLEVYAHPTIARLAVALDAMADEPAPRRASVLAAATARREQARQRDARLSPSARHTLAGALQAIALYAPLAFRAVQWCAPYYVFFALLAREETAATAVFWAMVTAALVFPALLTVAVAAKWALLGRIRPGRYPLWGTYHLRWWLVQSLARAIPFEYLSGTPLLPFVYRLFGARIGRDVQINTEHVAAFDLISIGDESCVDDDVSIAGAEVEDGELVIGPVTIGRRCRVGTRSVLREGAHMDDDARLEDLSFLPRGARVPPGETWAGSPARRAVAVPSDLPPRPVFTDARRAATAVLYAALTLVLPSVMLFSALPGLAILMRIDLVAQPITFLLLTPVLGALFALTLALQIVALKWALVWRVRPGRYAVHGSFYVRNWVVDQLMKLALDMLGPIHATLYAAPWYRALGAKLGAWVELSTASETTPDLIEIADGGTVADEVSLGSARVEGGWMTLATTRIGRRAFAGNSAVVPSGATIGDGGLIGVLSLAPTSGRDAGASGTAWLGSPPLRLPRREPSATYPDTVTYDPPRLMRRIRRVVELGRVTLPSAAFVVVSALVITATMALEERMGLLAALALSPILYGAVSGAGLLLVAAAKWTFDGRFRRFVQPLWSPFVWRLEFVNALYEFFATPILLDSLRGTPFLPWYLRLLGAKVGKRTYLDTTGFLEFDLVEIGDEAALNDDCVVQTHLFEDRVLKASKVRIGERCVVGTASVVLYDSVMEPGSRLDSLSLVMKGETLPAGTAWAGVPATWHDWRDLAPPRPDAARPIGADGDHEVTDASVTEGEDAMGSAA